jgi:hypothetical protein
MSKPTIALSSGHVFILENSVWTSLYRDGHATTVEKNPHMFWILLQHSLDELSSMAARACLDASIPAEQCPALPVEGIIRGGLTSNSAEWQMLGLTRADEFDKKDLLEPEISQLVTAGKTQAIRHRALKLRARLRRERSGPSNSS